jgi:hypothetical protein
VVARGVLWGGGWLAEAVGARDHGNTAGVRRYTMDRPTVDRARLSYIVFLNIIGTRRYLLLSSLAINRIN